MRELNSEGKEEPTMQAAERPGPVVPDEPGQQVGGEEDEPVRVPRPQRLPPPRVVRAAASARLRRSTCLDHSHIPACSRRRRCSRGGWSASPRRSSAGFLRGGGAAGLGARLLRVAAAMPCEIRTRNGGSEGKRELTGGDLFRLRGTVVRRSGCPVRFAPFIKLKAGRSGQAVLQAAALGGTGVPEVWNWDRPMRRSDDCGRGMVESQG